MIYQKRPPKDRRVQLGRSSSVIEITSLRIRCERKRAQTLSARSETIEGVQREIVSKAFKKRSMYGYGNKVGLEERSDREGGHRLPRVFSPVPPSKSCEGSERREHTINPSLNMESKFDSSWDAMHPQRPPDIA